MDRALTEARGYKCLLNKWLKQRSNGVCEWKQGSDDRTPTKYTH